MSDGILVHHESLDQMIVEMRQHVAAMRGRIDQLMTDLSPLREQFEGQAKMAHTEVQAQVNRHFERLGEVLTNAAIAVTSAQANYGNADARGARQFYDIGL